MNNLYNYILQRTYAEIASLKEALKRYDTAPLVTDTDLSKQKQVSPSYHTVEAVEAARVVIG